MSKIDRLIKKTESYLTDLQTQKKAQLASKKFKCLCGKFHRIKDCEAVQTHWYNDAAYEEGYIEEDLKIICPISKGMMKLKFNDWDTPYELRHKLKYSLEKQFKNIYKHLFKRVYNDCEKDFPKFLYYNYVTNNYFDENRKYFELIEKYKKPTEKSENYAYNS